MVGSEAVKHMIKKKFPSLSSLGSDGNTSFLRAARAGHLDKVLEHLRNNVDINTSNSNGLNALHLASKDGHVAVVTELLKRGASVDSATKKGNTALHIASLAGQEEVVRLLVEHGASVNVQSQNGFTPLYMAAQESHDNVVKYLLANGANQSLATEDGFTPLAVAMQQGHDKVVAVLLENDTRGKVRLPALHIAAKKDDCKAAALLLQNEHNPDVTSKSGFTPLHIASHYGNEGIANLLLNKGADVNYSAKHNITPLHVAAKWGKSNMVSLLLEKGANIESRTRDGLTPLHCAARSGHEQVVDMLLERSAPISSKTKNGLAPLHMSSQGDHVDAARILLYHRAPVDEVTVDYLTALHVAAHCGHARVAKLLLDRKADPNARALNGFTPLHIACKKNRIKVVELLLKHGASIEATTESGLTPLHVASFMGCMNIVIYLLQNEANPDVPTVRGETPLHLAARANQTDIIRILLRNGAQVDARAREQQTPLHIAARLGNVDIVMLLLQHGAAADCTTKDLYSALHIAAKEGQDEVAAVLLENGASPTATTKKGFTPLHLASKYGNMKVARLLLQRDAPVDAQGKNGVTPLHVASHYDHQNVALLLLDKGASPHATAKNGHTPLHIAAKKNQMDIATTLLEYGAKASAESKAGFTPLHLSAQEGHTDMSCLLLDHHADTNHKAKNGLTPLHLCAQEDRVNVASVLVKNGAEVNATTKAGYTPLHVACHFGQLAMVKFLLEEGGDVTASTAVGYTPLHQAAQQGHCAAVNCLLERGAPPNATTNQGQTAMSIAQKLGYISVVETLKGVTEVTTITPTVTDEKYKVVSPETMQETFMSDSEDEGGEDTLLSEQPYRYLTVDEMKSLGDDSLPIDVRQDERQDSNRECMTMPPTAVDDTVSPQHLKEAYSQFTTPDNIDITKHPLHVGFLVSFLVDARGGAMRGCRHSGVRVIVPPRRASMPVRVTCRYLKRDKLSHPPPLMEGEALASRILELGPVGAKFLGPVMIEVPHFGSLRGKEREIVILRSDNGETWREHTVDCSEEAVQDVLNHSFDKEDLNQLEENARTTRILTTDFPHYFAVVTRVRQEVHAIGPEGGMVSSSVVPQVQAVFPQGALTKKIKVGLQAQPISAELAAKLLGNRVAVSPIVTVEPRRRKFHKPITLTIPKPQAANKGMINQYSGDAPTLRLLCSITGGTTRAQWEDVTGSTPFTFVNDCVSFTTTVSARFWLMDCRNVGDATKMATELYREAIHVPFMAKFVVFAKRVDPLEARLRIFCMTDDKEDKTLEHQEHFTEVAKSRDVEVLEGKTQYVEFAGNLVPVTKSGEQLQLGFRAFRENRLPFTVRVKDPHADSVGRTLFMREARLPKGEPPQQPICVLNIVLPEEIIPEAILTEHELHKYSFIQDSSGLESYQRVDLRLSDISNLLGEDWPRLAEQLEVAPSHINRLKSEQPHSVAQQGLAMLRLWLSQAGNKAQASTLETALSRIGRDDIVQQCVFNVDQSGLQLLKEESRDVSIRRTIPYSDKDIMKDSESIEDFSRDSSRKAGDIEKDDKEERKYEAEEKEVEEVKKSVSERRREIEKRLSLEKPIEKITETIIVRDILEKERDLSEKEIAEEKRVSSPEDEPSELSFEQKRLSFEQGKRVIEMKPDNTTMKEVKERADDSARLLAEERRLAEAVKENKSLVDESSIPFQEKRKSFEQGIKDDKSKDKSDAAKKEDLRRDSALFEGVSQGLIHLDAAYTAAPQVQDLLSPKVSKTPPPSPAEFKDITGTVAWTDDSPAVIPSKAEQSQDWAGKGKPDSTIEPSKQRKSSDGMKADIQTQVEDPNQISVTSNSPQQITETIDIKTTENKVVEDLEKDLKYQFTMAVKDKQTFNDTLNSITEFLESEKNYNCQENKLILDRSVTLVDTEVTSSDETDGSQSKSESEPKSDKSFMGKMSKKLFRVFKKDDKDKSVKKKGEKKKHKKEKVETPDENAKQPDDSKIFDITNPVIESTNKEIILTDAITVEVEEGKYKKITTEREKQPLLFSDHVNSESNNEDLANENREQNLNSSFQISKEEIKNTVSEMSNLSIANSNDLPLEGGKYTEKIAPITINLIDREEAKDKSGTIMKDLAQLTVYPAKESQSVKLKEFIHENQNDNSSEITEKGDTLKEKTIPEETPILTKENTAEKHTDGLCKDVPKSVKEDVILNIKALSDRVEESYLEKKDEVAKSTIESAEQETINVTDKVSEKVIDSSKKTVESFRDSKDKSKSFFGGIFSKKKDEAKVDNITTVNIADDKSKKARKYGVDETFNKTNDIMKETNITIDSTISSPEHSIRNVEESVFSDDLNGKIMCDIQTNLNEAVSSDSNTIQINKEKKSFFGSLFGKGDITADEGAASPLEDAEDINRFGNTFISEKVDIVVGTVVGEITEHADNNKIPVSDGIMDDLNGSKIKVKDLTVDLSEPTSNIKDTSNEIIKLATTDIEESLKPISESITQSKKDIVAIVCETPGELDNTPLNIKGNVAKDGYKEARIHGLETTQNGEKRFGSVTDHHIISKSEEIIADDKTKSLDDVDSVLGTLYQTNDIAGTGVAEGKAEAIIEEETEKARIAASSKDTNSGKFNNTTVKINSSVTLLEEKSEPKSIVQQSEKPNTPVVNPTQTMSIEKKINEIKENTSKAANYTEDKVVSFITRLSEPVDSPKQKDLKDIDNDLNSTNTHKNTVEIPKSIAVAIETEHNLANEKPTIIETNINVIRESIPSTTRISPDIPSDELCVTERPIEGENSIKNLLSKIVEQSKEVKDETFTLNNDVIFNAADITDNTTHKIIDGFKSVGETVKKIGEDTMTTTKDVAKQSEDLLSQGETKTCNIFETTSTSIKNTITPALETIIKETKHNNYVEKQIDDNVASSIENVTIYDEDKTDKAVTSIKSDLLFDASQNEKINNKGTPNFHTENPIETVKINKISDVENLSFEVEEHTEGFVKVDNDMKREITKDGDEITVEKSVQSIKKALETNDIESEEKINYENVINVEDTLPATKDTILNSLSKAGGNLPQNIDISPKRETDKTQLSETHPFKPCSKNDAVNESPLNDQQSLGKINSVNKISDSASTNDDKLNNILIDMLIEQECTKNSLSDMSNQFTKTIKEMEEANTLPEKHDTEVSEKHKKSVTSSPFKTAASFGEVESLISEEELKTISERELNESSSYVTTPTMQRRKIGGSQRLSREERPALREVTYMEYSSSDDDESNYIVTEPYDRTSKRTVTFQIDSEDEAYLKVSDSNSDPEIEVTEMTPSPDPTSKKQAQVTVEEGANQQDNKTKYNSDKITQKVERRFERMASETLESDPAVKFTTDREFQRMVSQLSNEEVDACLSQWDEGGLTPSEELDSTKDTIEGDLDPGLEALPEAFLDPTNPFYSSSPQWSDFEHNMTNTPDSLFWAFGSTPTSAIIQPNELDIPVQSVHVKGESAGEETKKSPGPSTTREGEEALLDLATGVQDKKESAAGSGPSSAK